MTKQSGYATKQTGYFWTKQLGLNTYLQGGQGNLSAEIIKNLVFDIPDDRSQSAVVDFLDMIDQRISKSLMKLESIATLRSALMQQLFI